MLSSQVVRSLFDKLPDEKILELGLKLDLASISKLCSMSRRLNSLFCEGNSSFWRKKYLQDFNEPDYEVQSWKEAYMKKASMVDVYTFGDNYSGQLGVQGRPAYFSPVLVPGLQGKAIFAGSFHTIVIDLNDEVWAFGSNSSGQLGLPPDAKGGVPQKVLLPSMKPLKAKTVAVGGRHTVVIDLENSVWVFGDNYHGQLGLGNEQSRPHEAQHYIPTQLPGIKAKAVSAGENHTVIVDLKGEVWTFGSNAYGQLGLGDTNHRFTPARIPGLWARDVSAGDYHTIIIDLDLGAVWSFGYNKYGQLGLGDTTDRIVPVRIPGLLRAKAVSAGSKHTILIASGDHDFTEDSLWVFGHNSSGQLGLRDYKDRLVPTQVSSPLTTEPFRIRVASAGGLHSAVIALDKSVWVFGSDKWGQLGLGTAHFVSYNEPIQLPDIRAKDISAGFDFTVLIGKSME